MKQEKGKVELTEDDKAIARRIARDTKLPKDVVFARMLAAKAYCDKHGERIKDPDLMARFSLEMIYGNIVPTEDCLPLNAMIEAFVSKEAQAQDGKRVAEMVMKVNTPYGVFEVVVKRAKEGGAE